MSDFITPNKHISPEVSEYMRQLQARRKVKTGGFDSVEVQKRAQATRAANRKKQTSRKDTSKQDL